MTWLMISIASAWAIECIIIPIYCFVILIECLELIIVIEMTTIILIEIVA